MAKYIHITDEEKRRAYENANALQYALSKGYNLIQVGNEFHLSSHHSMEAMSPCQSSVR